MRPAWALLAACVQPPMPGGQRALVPSTALPPKGFCVLVPCTHECDTVVCLRCVYVWLHARRALSTPRDSALQYLL